jgi:hypothetical protein
MEIPSNRFGYLFFFFFLLAFPPIETQSEFYRGKCEPQSSKWGVCWRHQIQERWPAASICIPLVLLYYVPMSTKDSIFFLLFERKSYSSVESSILPAYKHSCNCGAMATALNAVYGKIKNLTLYIIK